ncbi:MULTISPECIES: mycofactocin precursor MftA [Pseudofrankia]|jgi:mycofactocin precursor|nr:MULTISPECIES: mycofactocin precursor MftA [Pseudofrankia]OHV38222.1 mycofactocin precursor [Pseudofrankia sp. EUN1h]
MDSSAPTTDIALAGTETSATVEPIVEDLLVEDVSIDGMCGVY